MEQRPLIQVRMKGKFNSSFSIKHLQYMNVLVWGLLEVTLRQRFEHGLFGGRGEYLHVKRE